MGLEGRVTEPDGLAEVWVEAAEFSDMVDDEDFLFSLFFLSAGQEKF